MTLADLIGLAGVACCKFAYAGLQLGRLSQTDLRYLLLNLLGPACLIYSLSHDFNFAALLTQVLWLMFTLIGAMRMVRRRRSSLGPSAPKRP